ncbi:MAG: hypothetical protein QNJ45_03610 [Ardenticatenaceae bacterium]|nr:hypothetical protein [Ardenticatenaceae bacterium]
MRRDTSRPQRTLSTTHNYLFLSDLHLSEGIHPQTGKLSRNEDFFYDDALARFLVYHANLTKDLAADPIYQKPWKLYINGDFLEFLQVTTLPDEQDRICHHPHVQIKGNVKKFGLGTSEAESIWKLRRIVEGHPLVFQALGWFLAHPENELVILKGNHDIEIFWPRVREALLDQIAHQYHLWYRKANRGFLPDSPLPMNGHPELLPPDFRERVEFPTWFAYEPPLFFVEHGNQYDPDNAFTDFVNPILEEKPHLIELPGGSFFVRYFFNQVEQLHPFADNLRPLSRYINWVINQELGDVVRMVLKQPREISQAISQILRKRGKLRRGSKKTNDKRSETGTQKQRVRSISQIGMVDNPSRERYKERGSKLGEGQIHLLEELKVWAQHKAAGRNRRAMTSVVSQFLSRFLALVFLIWGLREFFIGDYLVGLGLLVVWGGISILRLLLTNQAETAHHYVDLQGVSKRIRYILNREYRGQYSGVQFHIFGHDHQAAIEELSVPDQKLPFRQWYVNTGSWLPSFNELDRLTRDDAQLVFLRLIPDRPDFQQAIPELLEWLPGEDRPVPVRILDNKK